MTRNIVGFRLDQEKHWVADLECGHSQHVRHDPPWTLRPWVTTAEGREAKMAIPLNCVRCDELAREIFKTALPVLRSNLAAAYEAAGMSGLCEEGRWDVALDALSSFDTEAWLKTLVPKS